MKKILYILFTVSLLAVGCTEEVSVSRNHNLNAEVGDLQTKMEMKALYCNLNGAENLNLQKLSEYLTEQNADVAMFVAPASVGGMGFKAWLNVYAAELEEQVTVYEVRNEDNRLSMAALVKNKLQPELPLVGVSQGQTLQNAVLRFKANGINFVVTELEPARNAIPSNWEAQVAQMTKDKATSPLVYEPDNLATRYNEITNIINQTIDNIADMKEAYWMWAINMNAESPLDMVKYEREFHRRDYYEDVTSKFLSTETKYFSVSELLEEDDAYFGVNTIMLERNMVDCNAVHHSDYTPSSIGGLDGTRRNFLYASNECWNMFEDFEIDTKKAAELGVTHYPIIVVLKSEE